uniref:Uncharacterized LOC100181536 n=1 Tax=Ciona intestinalis TaxID=7719 RepID=F6PU57_CIOIN|nr:uncharacterized protein LOC100181536 [Ciona intestinalis]|eukprot:XP_002130887.1 uncharacterized protein LOC100181536 [Ciona intestinalis]
MTMGTTFSRCIYSKPSKPFSTSSLQRDEDLMIIRNHPNRVRRRSSVAPTTPRIVEDKILEELCFGTDTEPDVPADRMKGRDILKLIRKVSTSDALAGIMKDQNTSATDTIKDFQTSSASSMGSSSQSTSSPKTKNRGSLTRADEASLDEIIRSISEM